jgi:hypothetical protein
MHFGEEIFQLTPRIGLLSSALREIAFGCHTHCDSGSVWVKPLSWQAPCKIRW